MKNHTVNLIAIDMTTRGQKRSNDATTSNVSESGTVINMLTSDQTEKRIEDVLPIVPAIAKDIDNTGKESPAAAKDQPITTSQSTNPAIAKDTGKLKLNLTSTKKVRY